MSEPIVIGVALRDDDIAPVALGRAIARAADVPVTLVHVCHIDTRAPVPHPDYESTLRAGRMSALVGWDVLGASELLTGAATEALARVSGDLDLLVCGSRGYGPMRGLLHGSVSARLAHSCACPLPVMPP